MKMTKVCAQNRAPGDRRRGLGPLAAVGSGVLSLALALAACDGGAAPAAAASGQPRSVRGLLLAIDGALQRGSSDELAALMLDAASIRALCPELEPAALERLEQGWAKRPVSACVALTDWSQHSRRVPQFPGAQGLNIGKKVCDEAWQGCAAITRMCKSEIFYVMPATPDAGFKVNVTGIVRIGGEYRLIRAPRCMAKGTNANH